MIRKVRENVLLVLMTGLLILTCSSPAYLKEIRMKSALIVIIAM